MSIMSTLRMIFIIIIIIIIISNLFFVGMIKHRKILQIVFRPKILIKANFRPSKIRVLKYTFQQSFKFHNWWKQTYMHINKCKYVHAYKRTHIYMYTKAHIPIYAHARIHIYTIHKHTHIRRDRQKSTIIKTKLI